MNPLKITKHLSILLNNDVITNKIATNINTESANASCRCLEKETAFRIQTARLIEAPRHFKNRRIPGAQRPKTNQLRGQPSQNNECAHNARVDSAPQTALNYMSSTLKHTHTHTDCGLRKMPAPFLRLVPRRVES